MCEGASKQILNLKILARRDRAPPPLSKFLDPLLNWIYLSGISLIIAYAMRSILHLKYSKYKVNGYRMKQSSLSHLLSH